MIIVDMVTIKINLQYFLIKYCSIIKPWTYLKILYKYFFKIRNVSFLENKKIIVVYFWSTEIFYQQVSL